MGDDGKIQSYLPAGKSYVDLAELYLADVDGDGNQEIIVPITVFEVGAGGLYNQVVVKYSNGKFIELLKTHSTENAPDFNLDGFDTGFEIYLQNNFKAKIVNKYTGYKKIITLNKSDPDTRVCYHTEGTTEEKWGLPSVFLTDFSPVDFDKNHPTIISWAGYTWGLQSTERY